MRSIFLTLFSLICFSVTAQVDDFQQDIINYLNINGTYHQYTDAYVGTFDVLKKNFKTANVPEKVWEELKTDKEKSMKELISFLSFAYRKHFTHEEINTMTNFYKTKAAQQMIAQDGILTNSDNAEIKQFFESDLGKKIEQKRLELSEEIAIILRHWKRDLFAAKMSILVKKGYSAH